MDIPTFDGIMRPDAQDLAAGQILTLLSGFDRQKIAYCYWKSSRRVRAALSGESDLDVLVAKQDQYRAQEVLLQSGFKYFPAVANRDHPDISSFLGYDEPSGRLIHVHLHSRLVVGETLLKNYRIAWEQTILDRAVAHKELPIRVLDPADEALLMVVRWCLELVWMDPVALRDWAALRRKFELDRAALAGQLDRTTLRNRAGEVFTEELAELATGFIFDGGNFRDRRRLRRRIRKELGPWRSYGAVEALLRSAARAVLWVMGGLNDRLLHVPRPWRRRAQGGGCVVAVIGVDGSGKSTTMAAIRAWLRAEIDVVPIYFGTGGGRPSMLLLPFKLMVPLITRCFATKPQGSSHGNVSSRPAGPVYSVLLTTWAAVLAVEKRIKLLAARRGVERGLVVLADRYPQNEEPSYNDGPLLPRLNRVPQGLRRFEASAYALARDLPPDLVIKLVVTPQTAAKREPDMDPTVIGNRIEAARRLTFPGARVVSLDAEEPLEDVVCAIKREVWRML